MLKNETSGTWFLVYTASDHVRPAVLRRADRPSDLAAGAVGLLLGDCRGRGLYWLGNAGDSLGHAVSGGDALWRRQDLLLADDARASSPSSIRKGGALLLNAISGVGMIAVGTIGGPAIGTLQDIDFNRAVAQAEPAVHEKIVAEKEGLFSEYQYVDPKKFEVGGTDEARMDRVGRPRKSAPSSTPWPRSPRCR